MTAAASWSSINASSRCSSVAYSWCRSLASAKARWRDCSRLREKVGIIGFSSCLRYMGPALLLFHDALQRMLVFSGKVHNLRHLGLRDLVGEDAAFPDAVLVNMHHNAVGRFLVLIEKALQHMHHELHRGVVVIEQKHPVKTRPLGLRLGLADDRRPGRPRIAAALSVVVSQTWCKRRHACCRHPIANSRSHGLLTGRLSSDAIYGVDHSLLLS